VCSGAEIDGQTKREIHDPPRSANSFLTSLPTAEFALLEPHLRPIEMRRQSLLARAGDEISHVYFPHGGVISLVVNLADGATIEVAMVGREGLLNGSAALCDEKSLHSAIVTQSGTASAIEVERFRHVARRSDSLRLLLGRQERILFVQAQQSAACNAVHPAGSRLSRWLLQMADRSGRDVFPLTQDFVARMLGIQRNSVTIAANALQQAGLIRCRRGQIEITDREGLAANACECYGEVVRQTGRLLRRSRDRK
jgi:CRP-like cAMP-binding protein